ncbi:MAG: hypothetical protein HDT01_03550 [Bacteroidales bacterium]|nr:hypothetical protein [Bacteroidales bacterium]
MKKIILSLAAVALTMGLSSCGNKATDSQAYSAEDKAFGDSLSLVYGQYLAANMYNQFQQQLDMMPADQREGMSRAEFVRGLKAVANRDTADVAYIMGLNAGTQIWGASKGMPAQLNVPVNTELMIKGFEKVFTADTIGDTFMYQTEFQGLITRAQELATERANRKLESLPESIENKAKGEEYAKAMLNEGYEKSESGLVYKIIEPGEGEKVQKSDRIQLRYVGKHINGEVFDQTNDEPMTSYAGRFIPGFTEGLMLLGKGGKATIVIPAEIAYGVAGQGDAIGHNETLVFDIEVVDIL